MNHLTEARRHVGAKEVPGNAFWLLGTLHGWAAAYNMTVNCK